MVKALNWCVNQQQSLLLFVYFQVNNGVVYLDYEDSHHHGRSSAVLVSMIVSDLSLLFDNVLLVCLPLCWCPCMAINISVQTV